MNSDVRWIDLIGAVNVRDLGGLPTRGGATTEFGRILRADNLQDLTDGDISHLVDTLNLRDVVDLRSRAEITMEGPGPLTRIPDVTIHHFSMLAEAGDETVDGEAVLPWAPGDDGAEATWLPPGEFYLAALMERPESVLGALRVLARSNGAALAHCAAGKDRTGVLVALTLTVVGVPRDAIVDDYALTNTRIEKIIERLRNTATYADDLDSRPMSSHFAVPEAINSFLDLVDEKFGGLMEWLNGQNWTAEDTDALRARLLG